MAAGSPLRRRPQLSDEVASHVRGRIMTGELKPGAFIRLDETAANLGVSVTPVREALLTLRGEGLVDLVPRRGYSVSPMSRRDIEDIFWLQDTIMRRIVARAVEEFEPADVDALEQLTEDFAKVVADRDVQGVVAAQFAIHRYINLAARSDKLARFLRTVSRYLPYMLYAGNPEWQDQALESHRQAVEAFRRRDTQTVIDIISNQFSEGAELLIARLEEAGVWDAES